MRFVYSVSTLRARWERDFSLIFENIDSFFSDEHSRALALAVRSWVLDYLRHERLSARLRSDVVRILNCIDSSPSVNEKVALFSRDVMLRR